MNVITELKLRKFLKFHLAYKNTINTSPLFSYSIYGLAKTILEYYGYTLASFDLYSNELKKYINKDYNSSHDVNLMITSAFGIYTNGNVCLQIAKKLNDYIRDFSDNIDINNQLNDVSKNTDIKDWSEAFRKKRNLIVVHPTHSKNSTNNCNCLPDKCARLSGWGSGGFSFDIYSMLTGHTHSEYEVIPYEEIEKLHNYLEELAPIYSDFFIET